MPVIIFYGNCAQLTLCMVSMRDSQYMLREKSQYKVTLCTMCALKAAILL